MLALNPDQKLGPRWLEQFQKLNESDICGPGHKPDEPSKGQFTPSWIWLIPHSGHPCPAMASPNNLVTTSSATNPSSGTTTGTDKSAVATDKLNDSMCTHWAKCQAQVEQYKEEVTLTVDTGGEGA